MPNLTQNFAGGGKVIGDPLHPIEDKLFDTGGSPLAAVNATAGPLMVQGASFGVFSVSGTYSLTFVVEATRDDVNWRQIPFKRRTDGAVWLPQWSTASTADEFIADIAGFSQWRVRCSAFTSGTLNVEMASVMAALPPLGFQRAEPAAQSVTTFGTANTAATLTLAAPGAGLFIYLRRLLLRGINGTATLVAASAILQITTTNLPGTRNWRRENNFPAWSSLPLVDEQWPLGLRASAANTAVTIVAPALGTGVQAEITADYLIGP